MANSGALLSLRDINKYFPGVHALKDAHFEVRRGEVHALIGENGAGKSTMIKIISGVYQPDTGEIYLDGRRVAFATPREAHSAGIATIYQELGLYPELTVAEKGLAILMISSELPEILAMSDQIPSQAA